jgi:N-acetylneuraminic acid mutarotase
MYVLDKGMNWEQLDTDMPNQRSQHCMVQINDCEVALIGGVVTDYHDNDESSTVIDIYNWKTNTWREEGGRK